MNTILGLDIGVGSVGFALIELIENDEPKIITTGVRLSLIHISEPTRPY